MSLSKSDKADRHIIELRRIEKTRNDLAISMKYLECAILGYEDELTPDEMVIHRAEYEKLEQQIEKIDVRRHRLLDSLETQFVGAFGSNLVSPYLNGHHSQIYDGNAA